MGVERIDYSSDAEYQQAQQAELAQEERDQERQWQERAEAEAQADAMTDKSGIFYPNALADADIDSLGDWQLLVAACHYGDKMGDCRELNYGYYFCDGDIFLAGKAPVCLKDDIDITDPIGSMERYANFDWREYAREKIRKYTGEAKP